MYYYLFILYMYCMSETKMRHTPRAYIDDVCHIVDNYLYPFELTKSSQILSSHPGEIKLLRIQLQTIS